jgi:hypothetical protein
LRASLVGRDELHDRDLYVARITNVDEWPERIDEPRPHFIVFLAIDAVGVDTERLKELARKLTKQGMAELCAWGPDCSRVHDVFDLVDAEFTSTGDAFTGTTWHDDEDLDDALWYALVAAALPEAYWESCRAILAIVDRLKWAETIERAFAAPKKFADDVLAREN